ncbi:hypothetical protein AB6A40_010221 [Gnathostoma spinigerum]|uniref:Neurotransmitter-gated ion-channel ligand-binding domain-containing protein n=1 Tax=Gnathostoma spinigerum TaxID=75299 RepID=A0ABD6F2B3_9BILA
MPINNTYSVSILIFLSHASAELSAECEKCDLRSSYCKHYESGNVECECRSGFSKGHDGRCYAGLPASSDACVLGHAEKVATRILTELLKKYDRNLVPKMAGVDVDVEVLIQKISEISELYSSSKMDIFLSQIWHDPGLSFQVTVHLITSWLDTV